MKRQNSRFSKLFYAWMPIAIISKQTNLLSMYLIYTPIISQRNSFHLLYFRYSLPWKKRKATIIIYYASSLLNYTDRKRAKWVFCFLCFFPIFKKFIWKLDVDFNHHTSQYILPQALVDQKYVMMLLFILLFLKVSTYSQKALLHCKLQRQKGSTTAHTTNTQWS